MPRNVHKQDKQGDKIAIPIATATLPEEPAVVLVKETLIETPVKATLAKEVVLVEDILPSTVIHQEEAATVVEVAHEAAIHEVIKPTERREVQEIIRRDIDEVEVHQITQPILEQEVLPLEVKDVLRAPVARDEIILGSQEILPLSESSTLVIEDVQKEVILKPVIIEEVVHRKIVEEIQPIVYREVTQPVLIREVVPMSEHIVRQPIVTQELRAPIVHKTTPLSQIIPPTETFYAEVPVAIETKTVLVDETLTAKSSLRAKEERLGEKLRATEEKVESKLRAAEHNAGEKLRAAEQKASATLHVAEEKLRTAVNEGVHVVEERLHDVSESLNMSEARAVNLAAACGVLSLPLLCAWLF